MSYYGLPSAVQVGLSMSTWLLSFVGSVVLSAELHPWVNTVILTVIFPAYMWLAARNSILGSVSSQGIIMMLVTAGLFMTLLLEAQRDGQFSRKLKRNIKRFGKDPRSTGLASLAVASSLIVGAGLSYAVLRERFIEV